MGRKEGISSIERHGTSCKDRAVQGLGTYLGLFNPCPTEQLVLGEEELGSNIMSWHAVL